ncbi:oxygen-independent coproporphyrinogen III oxidase [Helicobacter monodelphidis]|uniref:oxygen-independent coproporphyrinogen III oxidase n=1 Tax=Helicobacter sp. 15-1451 TaxID=2004995 RepID=UPI000DCE573D|nr:oxygen-independent coproporphyrinogen III oxidase [Helicobacter sp. 15-1451]RAX58200.1 oxygen-independent coproporphyrinogen III oxidase [Helicobacter sp. 15-1451]
MFDVKKFATYSTPGPRYTSYPTANEFHTNFTQEEYLHFIKLSQSPLSLYIHLPFCRSACYFCGCNVIYTSKQDKKTRYIQYLKKELALLKETLDCNKPVVQLHFGGGTPTFMSAQELEEILQAIHETFPNFAADSENSCEIDPRFFEPQQMEVLKNGGINRLSFGIQDFNSSVQEAIHRIQPQELVAKAVQLARDYGISSINFDLIYGLPKQNLTSFQQTLEIVNSLNPDRLAIFNYAHVPWLKKSMRKINETELPSPEEKLYILQFSIQFLQEHGYNMIGMDHFAKATDELFLALKQGNLRRNFQGYTTKGGSQTIGIGVTSIGEGEQYYAQNYKEMIDYERAIDEGRLPLFKGISLTPEDRLRKAVIMQLMSNFHLCYADIYQEFKINFTEYFAKELQQLQHFEEAGLCVLNTDSLDITQEGTMLVRNIVMPFDTFLKSNSQERKFSKTI